MIKWIGQHIVDFIARFRSDVYLEDIADGTVVDNKFLGLDSNNKIVKEAASATVTDLHSAGVDGSANQLLTDDGDGTVTSEANLVFHNDTLTLTSTSAAGRPHLTLQNDETSSASPILQFEKTATGADDDDLGRIIFKGDDEGDGSHTYANILGEIADATPGEEAGRLSLQVAEFDGTVTTGVLINGDTDADGEVDVTIAAGAASTTTIAGDLTVSGGDIYGPTDGDLNIRSDQDVNIYLDSDSDGTERFAVHSGVSTPFYVGENGDVSIGGDISVNGTDHTFTSATADKPVLSLINTNTTSDSNASLKFIKDAANVADGEFLGEILFIGDNDAGTPEQIDYARIWSRIADMTDGSEKGALYLGVASYDGEMQPGISIESGNSEDEVDVIIGNGANSITHIDGYVTVGSLATHTDSVSISANTTVGNNGGNFKVEGSKGNGTNKNGGPLQLSSGGSTGTGEGGSIVLQGTPPGSSGSSSNITLNRWTFYTGKTVPYASGPATGIGMQNWVDLHTNTFENSFTAGQAYEATYLKYAPAGTQNVTGNIGEIFYLHTDGSWAQADASATSTGATQLLGVIALGGALPNKGIILEGFIRIPTASILNTPGSGAVDGLPVYISTTAGHFDFTAPSGNDEYVRCVGYALDDHSGDVLVYFKPDNTFVKITA